MLNFYYHVFRLYTISAVLSVVDSVEGFFYNIGLFFFGLSRKLMDARDDAITEADHALLDWTDDKVAVDGSPEGELKAWQEEARLSKKYGLNQH